MFTDEKSENWDSTENQDNFIKEYFGKTTVLPKNQKTSQEAKSGKNSLQNHKNIKKKNEDYQKNIAHNSHQVNNKRSANSDIQVSNKKIKTLSSSLQDNTTEDETETKVSQATDFSTLKSKKKRKRSKKKKKIEEESSSHEISGLVGSDNEPSDSSITTEMTSGRLSPSKDTKSKFHQKLQAAKFRYLNEMLYTNPGREALSYFQENTDEFEDYHIGYQSQVSKWPINPVDIIIQEIQQMNKKCVIADLGCGEAKIAEVFPKRTVHSFDLIALKDCVTACDMTKVPLPDNSVDVAVFCLSLMGTNWKDYVKEGHRILKVGGVLKVAEIESRIEDVGLFIKNIENYGFCLENKNLSHKMFIFLNFKKTKKKKGLKVPDVTLKPCLYKKR